jgi:integrase/recombinase XerD
MSDPITLGPWLRRFLCEYIVTERNLSQNTRKSYQDTFSLLLPFISGKLRKPVDRLAVHDLTSRHVLQFLAHLEEERGCSARTRNQRLAAIRAFARFVGSRDPVHVEWCGHIRAIASKKSMPPPVGWLTKAEMQAMLSVPDRKTLRGNIYAEIDLTLKANAVALCEVGQPRPGRSWKEDKDLMAFLKSL